jgi:hypothetical protein
MESCPISFYNGLRRVVLPRTDCFGQYPLPRWRLLPSLLG